MSRCPTYPCGRYNWKNLKIHYDEQHCQRAVRSIALDMGTGCCGSQQCSVSDKRIIRTSVMPLIAWLLAATGCAIFLSHRTPHTGAGLMAVAHILLLVCIVYTCVLKPSFIWSNIWTNLEKFYGKYKFYQTWSNVNSYFSCSDDHQMYELKSSAVFAYSIVCVHGFIPTLACNRVRCMDKWVLLF